MDAATVQIDQDIRDTILSMGAHYANVVRDNKNKVMHVSFYRRGGGCGRIHVNVCNFLRKRHQDMKIVVLPSPSEGKPCHKARVREPGKEHFSKSEVPILVTADILGVA